METNPDQSKHLATACFRVHGLSLDVTNLRTETYALDSASRIPQVAVGTATEDAFRRDLTINSLFYNVNTEAVEDFTNRGIDDLSDGVIRTPLDPADTFREDPLRVLRIIRFAVRFNFRVDPSIFEAAKSASVHEDLLKKVSRERVGIEVGKVLGAARDARRALAFFRDAGLLESVFLARDTWSVSYGHDGLNQEAATQKAAEKAAEGWYSSLRKPTYFLQFVRPASGASFRSRRRRHMYHIHSFSFSFQGEKCFIFISGSRMDLERFACLKIYFPNRLQPPRCRRIATALDPMGVRFFESLAHPLWLPTAPRVELRCDWRL